MYDIGLHGAARQVIIPALPDIARHPEPGGRVEDRGIHESRAGEAPLHVFLAMTKLGQPEIGPDPTAGSRKEQRDVAMRHPLGLFIESHGDGAAGVLYVSVTGYLETSRHRFVAGRT